MKKIKLLSLAALTILAFACTKEQEQPVAKDAVTLKSTNMTVGKKGVTGAAGSAAVIEFTANNDWTATPSVEWITLDVASGKAGDVKLNVTVAENDTYEERSGEVVIACGEAKAKVTINQTLKDVFGVAVNKVIGYEAQTLTLAVGTNMEYDVNINCGEGVTPWISVEDTKAEPTLEGVNFVIEANMGNKERSAEITVGNTDAMVQYFITQEGRSNSTLEAVAYWGNRQKPYDTQTYTLTSFAQYAFALAKAEGSKDIAQVVINVNKADADKAVLPTGYFECDAAGAHVAKTFSIKPADESELGYTSISKEDGTEVLVLDGSVEISKKDNEYTIKCSLMNEEGVFEVYKYVGEVAEITDAGFGGVLYTSYLADYNTHFASAANQWNAEAYVSETIPDESEYVYKLGFVLYGEAGEVKMENIPAGTYTFATPETITTGYASGNLNAQPFTFTSSGVYSDYDVEAGTYRQGEIKGGTITISDVDTETGSMNVKFDLNLKTYYYNWDTYQEEEVREFNYACSLNTAKYIASDSGQRPILDVDQEFTGCMISSNYIDYWYGKDRFGVSGTNIFWWGLQYVNNAFNVQIPISSTGEWEFVINYGTRYCNTPLPEGTYTWSDKPAGDCICNIGTPASRKAIVTNSYTGKTAYICGGSITITNNHLDFNLTAKVGDKEVHYTGGFDAALSYSRDSHTSAITWDSSYKKIKLTADNISTNDPMAYVVGGSDDYGFKSNPDWFAPITADQKTARENKYGKAENMWDGSAETCFHTNMDWGKPNTSWEQRSYDINADRYAKRYIEVTLPTAQNKVDLYFTTSDSGRKAEGLDVQYSTDGSTFTKFGETQPVTAFGEKYEVKGICAESGQISKLRIVNTKADADWTYVVAAFGIAELKLEIAE